MGATVDQCVLIPGLQPLAWVLGAIDSVGWYLALRWRLRQYDFRINDQVPILLGKTLNM